MLIFGSLLILHFATTGIAEDRQYEDRLHSQYDVPSLLELIRIQNETIHTLERHLKHTILSKGDQLAEDAKLIEIADKLGKLSSENEENRLKAASCHNLSHELEHNFDTALQQARIEAASVLHCPEATVVTESHSGAAVHQPLWPTTKLENECEARYGLELAELWRKNEEVWCASPPGADTHHKSELKCYPYHQAHKKLDGRAADLICEASNFVIDFSKVVGDVVQKGKPVKGSEYLIQGGGALQSTCHNTALYQGRLFMPHHSIQVSTVGVQ